jgi:predicted Zn-ribbon and HTH transcriptional regulator
MQHETWYWNGEPAIWVRLGYDEAREFLVLDEEWIEYLDSLTASERDEVTLELCLVPLREVAEYAIGTTGKPTERLPSLTAATTVSEEGDYDECLYSLEGIDRAAYLEVLDRIARIIAREIRAWDTEDISRLVELLTKLDEIADRAGRKAEDYVRMSSLPSAPIPEEVVGYPVWAVDKQGMALVGPGADEIESIEEVRAACEEQSRRMKGVPLRCHKCGHIWTYRGGSQYRTTCPTCHITVYLDKCKIMRGGSGE